ncbi:MAG: hypothetical protein E7566_01420 [Ruminococcaceae bacterium]|nr:hypothetical protein [Oscillospiraceae bacterium]
MKKILAFMLVVILCFSLCGCMGAQPQPTVEYKDFEGGAVGTPDEFTASAATSDEAKPKYENNLKGLCTYLKDKNCVYAYKDAIVPTASMIGADEGYKFMYKYDGGDVVLEVYSYSDTDNKWYQQAKADGEITLLDETFEAILSENGKYLMIYSDSKERAERKDAIVEVFKSFYAE